MDSRLLRSFVAVVDEGTVSAAATELGITQPALSRQIRQLERTSGLELFRRSGSRLILTSEGTEFLKAAREVLQKLEHARRVAQQLVEGRLSTISIAAPETTLIDVVAPFVATFDDDDPVPSISEVVSAPDLDRLLPIVDLIVSARRPRTGVRSVPIAALPVWAYVPSGHRWSGRGTVGLEDLVSETLLVPSASFRARNLLDSALEVAGLVPRRVVETQHGRVAQALAAAGRGVAVLSDDPWFDLVPLQVRANDQDLRVELFATWRHDHHADATLRQLAARLKEFCRTHFGETLTSPRR